MAIFNSITLSENKLKYSRVAAAATAGRTTYTCVVFVCLAIIQINCVVATKATIWGSRSVESATVAVTPFVWSSFLHIYTLNSEKNLVSKYFRILNNRHSTYRHYKSELYIRSHLNHSSTSRKKYKVFNCVSVHAHTHTLQTLCILM